MRLCLPAFTTFTDDPAKALSLAPIKAGENVYLDGQRYEVAKVEIRHAWRSSRGWFRRHVWSVGAQLERPVWCRNGYGVENATNTNH